MFEKLKNKWKVSGLRLALIITTFAVGGSLTGYVSKKIMNFLALDRDWLWTIIYIILITLLWPVAVIIVSLFFGQYKFFAGYIKRVASKIVGSRESGVGRQEIIVGSRESGVGSKEIIVGSRESGVGSKEIIVGSQESGVRRQEMDLPNNLPTPDSRLPTPDSRLKTCIAIFASGAGSNAQKIIEHFKNSSRIKIALVVCNKPGAGVLNVASQNNIPTLLVEKERFFRGDGYLEELKKWKIDLIVLAGFLWKVPPVILQNFPKRVINIHPALLPAYGGKGMYGQSVHEAVLSAKEKESGITIHYVDEHYDNGDIILQLRCPVLPGDNADTLAQRIHALEHANYPVVIEELAKKLIS